MFDRPKSRTEEYFKYMDDIVRKMEEKYPISVYGFSDYDSISFYWILPNGEHDRNPCRMSFNMFVSLLER